MMFFSSIRRHTKCALVTGVHTCALPICDFSGARLPFSPKWQSSLSADCSLPLGGVNLTMGTTISSQSKSLGVLAITNADKDLYEVNGRTLVSARLGVEAPDGRWAVFGWGRNKIGRESGRGGVVAV